MTICKETDIDVAITGMSFRLPGIKTYEELADVLLGGLPQRPRVIEKVPKGYHGEFPAPSFHSEKMNELDHNFFAMSSAVFSSADRTQMKVLEVSYEALIDAGINPKSVKELMCHVYQNTIRTDGEFGDINNAATRFFILGNSRSMAPQRVSFQLDYKGQSVSLDSGYSGGMQGLDLAWRDVQSGRSDIAIVVSANVFIDECITNAMNNLGWLSQDGNTCVFDNEALLAAPVTALAEQGLPVTHRVSVMCCSHDHHASKAHLWAAGRMSTGISSYVQGLSSLLKSPIDLIAHGYARTEAAAALILQPGKDAKRIYTNLRHVSCMTSPNELSFQSPTQESWTRFLKEVYKNVPVPKHRIQYLEAYGSANKEWDAIELNAVMEVLGNERRSPLVVGSVKSNFGHCEGVADLVSIIKAIVCFEYGKIPANRNYRTPNTGVPSLLNGQLRVADKNIDLLTDALIAVNGYTHGNVYAHCILEGFKKHKTITNDTIPWLIPLSARVEDMFPEIFQKVEDAKFDVHFFNLLHEVFNEGINKHLARGYMVKSRGEKSITSCQAIDEQVRPLWLVFSGMGSQWSGMGRDLMKHPLTRASLDKCHEVLKPRGLSLNTILISDDPDIFKDNLNSFVGIAAVQIALVDILNALKIIPDGIIGHSLGELGCAYADGCLDLEQTMLSAYYRGKAVKDAFLQRGAMAAVGKGYNELKNVLPKNVEVACHNSSTSSTISGLEQPVIDYVSKLKKDNVFARIVEVGNIAFHSQFIAPAGSYLLSYMEKVIKVPKLRSNKWKSSSVPLEKWGDESALYASAEYFTKNLLNSVLFEETCSHIPENAILVEVAPNGLLQAIMKRSFPQGINISLTSRSAADNLTFLLQAIGRLHIAGLNPNTAALYPPADFPVPTKTNSMHGLFPWSTVPQPFGSSLLASKSTINIRQLIKKSDMSNEEHIFRGYRCTPISYHPFLVWNVFYQVDPSIKKSAFCITDLCILDPFALSIGNDLEIEGLAMTSSHLIELTKEGKFFASAFVTKTISENAKSVSNGNSFDVDMKALLQMHNDEIYGQLAKKGYTIAKSMRFIKYAEWTAGGIRAKMAGTTDWKKKIEALLHLVYLKIASEEDGLVTVRKIGRIEIDICTIESCDGDLELFYNPATNELSCSGVYLQSISFKREPDRSAISMASLLPLFNPPLKNVQEYIQFCSSIVTNNIKSDESVHEWKILEMQQEHLQLLSPHIQTFSPNVKVHLISVGQKPSWSAAVDLVICNNNQLRDFETRIVKYVLVRDHGNIKDDIKVPDSLSFVSTFTNNKEEKMALLKKKVILNGEQNFIKIPTKEMDLILALKKRAAIKTNALLVGWTEPADGIPNFIRRIQSQTSLALKWMFILDESAPEFSVSNSFYQEQLEKGLFLNVLLDGSWNFLHQNIIESSKDTASTNRQRTSPFGTNMIKQSDTIVMSCDPHLSWTIPPSWPIDDNDNVASAYALAYNCLVVKAITKPHDAVLITDGCSLLGQAALAVALPRTDRVYATVASKEEAAELIQLFPKVKKENIIFHLDQNFPILLKLRIGADYPNIIYNLLEGNVLHNLLYHARTFSRIFHFGKDDIEKNSQVSMFAFHKDVLMSGVDAGKIADWCTEEKEAVHRLVDEGIRSGVVRSIKPCHSHIASEISSKIQLQSDRFFKDSNCWFNSHSAYLIIGNSNRVDLDIAVWLVRQGAKNVFVHNPLQSRRKEYRQKLHLLKNHSNVRILNEIAVKDLLGRNKRQHDEIDAAFFINLLEDSPILEMPLVKEAVSAGFRHYITISRNRQRALKIHKPLQRNKKWTDIVWRAEEYLIPQNMDVLSELIGNHSYLTVDSLTLSSYKNSLNVLGELLIPSSVDSYCRLGQNLPNEPTLVELVTRGRKMANSTIEIQPVFFFPGIEDNAIEGVINVAKELSGPAFIAKLPCAENKSIVEMASLIIPAIANVAKRKVYNLVGLSTGCVVAMEVARQMEQRGAVVALLLVDNPAQYLHQFTDQSNINSVILDSLACAIPNEMEGRQDILPRNLQLNQLISSLNLPPTTENLVHTAISHVKYQLNAIAMHDVDDLKLGGPLTVIRSEDFSDQLAYSQICVDSYVTNFDVKHVELIKSIQLAKLIDKFIVLDDVAPKTIHEVLWVPFEGALDRIRMILLDSNQVADW